MTIEQLELGKKLGTSIENIKLGIRRLEHNNGLELSCGGWRINEHLEIADIESIKDGIKKLLETRLNSLIKELEEL